MSRICPITNKKPLSGNNRSHSMRATRRIQNVNIQKFKINVDGTTKIIKMSVKAHRIFLKNKNKKSFLNKLKIK